jgi:polyvinyl alcohol dehydrogenase (cytochrome)
MESGGRKGRQKSRKSRQEGRQKAREERQEDRFGRDHSTPFFSGADGKERLLDGEREWFSLRGENEGLFETYDDGFYFFGIFLRIGRLARKIVRNIVYTFGAVIFLAIAGMVAYNVYANSKIHHQVNKIDKLVHDEDEVFLFDDDDDAIPDAWPGYHEDDGWASHGRDHTNNRHAKPAQLNPLTVASLRVRASLETERDPSLDFEVPTLPLLRKRSVITDGDNFVVKDTVPNERSKRDAHDGFVDYTGSPEGSISVPPLIRGPVGFVPAWDGRLYAFDSATLEIYWSKDITDYFPGNFYISRNTPVLWSVDDDDCNGEDDSIDSDDDDDCHSARAYFDSDEDDDYLIIGSTMTLGPAFEVADAQKIRDNDPYDEDYSIVHEPLNDRGAYLVKINARTGEKVGDSLRVHSHPQAIMTASGTLLRERLYVGVSSLESIIAVDPTYPCCGFVGKLLSIDVNPGGDRTDMALDWEVETIDPVLVTEGFYGAASFGSSPPVDTHDYCDDDFKDGDKDDYDDHDDDDESHWKHCDGAVYFGTGNLYTIPPEASDCLDAYGIFYDYCDTFFSGAWSDTIFKINARTGEVGWRHKLGVWSYDAWNAACDVSVLDHANCDFTYGPDGDFGASPMLAAIGPKGKGRTQKKVVIAGQKTGEVWALDRDTHDVIWRNNDAPGGLTGGVNWGMCTDGRFTYVPILNDGGGESRETCIGDEEDCWSGNEPPRPIGLMFPDFETAYAGGWMKIDNDNGKTMAVKAVPAAFANPNPPNFETYRRVEICTDDDGCVDPTYPEDILGTAVQASYPVCSDGLIFAGSTDIQGGFYALDTNSFEIVWQTSTGGAIYGGAAIVKNRVYIGSGYRADLGFSTNNKMWMYELDDKLQPLTVGGPIQTGA